MRFATYAREENASVKYERHEESRLHIRYAIGCAHAAFARCASVRASLKTFGVQPAIPAKVCSVRNYCKRFIDYVGGSWQARWTTDSCAALKAETPGLAEKRPRLPAPN